MCPVLNGNLEMSVPRESGVGGAQQKKTNNKPESFTSTELSFVYD